MNQINKISSKNLVLFFLKILIKKTIVSQIPY